MKRIHEDRDKEVCRQNERETQQEIDRTETQQEGQEESAGFKEKRGKNDRG